MIVPQNRLMLWFAVVAIPFAILGALLPQALAWSLLVVTALLFLLTLDAVMAWGRLEGLQVVLPELTRLSKDRPGRLEIKIRHRRPGALALRLGLPLPEEFQSPTEDCRVLWPGQGGWIRVSWDVRPTRRGRYTLGHAYAETGSGMGFWAVRCRINCPAEIRVYPNLLTERRHLAGLFLNRGTYGIHARRQVGKGREFEKLRDYIPGDGSEDIHWKATAKRGHPVTKVFQIERTQAVYVVIDTSRLSARELPSLGSGTRGPRPGSPAFKPNRPGGLSGGEPMLERYLTAALVLGLAAEQQGDLFGLITFSDQVETFLRAKRGRAHYDACREAVYKVQSRPVTPDFEELASFIRLRLRRRVLLVFLTALDDPVLAEGFVRGTDLLARQHLLLVNLLKPEGAEPVFSRANVQGVDDLYARLAGHLHWVKLRALQKGLQRRGVTLALLENERFSVQLVTQYLEVKRRQIL